MAKQWMSFWTLEGRSTLEVNREVAEMGHCTAETVEGCNDTNIYICVYVCVFIFIYVAECESLV